MKKNDLVQSEKVVVVDLNGVFTKVSRQRGAKMNAVQFAKEYDLTNITVHAWNKEAPKAIRVLFKFLKDNNLKFEDVVKEY